MRKISARQRRRAIVRRPHLGGDAGSPEAVTQAMMALHATDPASVYLSVLARSAGSTLADVADAMYERRSLVRWMAMRRTLFVFPRADIPVIQAAVSTPLAAMLRRRLISQLERNGSEPGDPASATPAAALLPALDPTPMGWKRRDWFLGIDRQHLFDRNGNIGARHDLGTGNN